MPDTTITITHGRMSQSRASFAWVEYSNEPLPDDAKALIMASTANRLVLVIGPDFSIEGKVAVISIGHGAKFCIVCSREAHQK
ncbi:hypothetical protein [Deinococcus sp. QL22]|uniref:hypothetical protein n=1 Tax=Deinococcus sp. QL22 TaxID=2939437 RepID=UPI0020175933|nr:hypothetical protein [Deinococcus sp. QL22]UQN05476.1 hypothetical protein M1R55_11380 [Deinococcus sp. QL22]